MENIDSMSDEQKSIYFMQRFRQYKSEQQFNKINCTLQYPSWCTSCGGRQSYMSMWGICIDQILYNYYKESWVVLDITKLQHRVSDGTNIYTI
jgi:hypothetical protein